MPRKLGGPGVTVHDGVAHAEEALPNDRLREEIREVIARAHVGHDDLLVLHSFTHEEVSALDVLRLVVVLGVVGEGDGRLVVTPHLEGGAVVETHLAEMSAEVDGLLGTLRRCHDFRLTRGKCNRLLPLATP